MCHFLSKLGIRGAANHHTARKDIEKDIFEPLGPYYLRRSYRMNKDSFYTLHDILQVQLEDHFFPKRGGRRNVEKSPYIISTKIRLSIAIRYFAGGSPYDIMLVHGVSHKSVFTSIWGVIDAVNSCEKLAFHFPNHTQQQTIANGFQLMSGAKFGNVVGAIDGILIWMLKPSLRWCRISNCGESQYNVTGRTNLV